MHKKDPIVPARVAEALSRYDRLQANAHPWTAEDRWNSAALAFLLQGMSPAEADSYYAGVADRVKARG
jgi:hypothetical protein